MILLILSSDFFSRHFLSTESLSIGHHEASNHSEAAAAVVVPTAAALPHKIAIPFGSRNVLRRNASYRTDRPQHTDTKRFDTTWIDTLTVGAKLLGMLRSGRRTDTPYLEMTDLTGPEDLTEKEVEDGKGKAGQFLWTMTGRQTNTTMSSTR